MNFFKWPHDLHALMISIVHPGKNSIVIEKYVRRKHKSSGKIYKCIQYFNVSNIVLILLLCGDR